MQALIFGANESELQYLTGFSSDTKCRFLSVHFRDDIERHIGLREDEREEENERKTFTIDGQGNERVSKVEVGMNHLPTGIKVCL